jgi:hypothetical protein
MMGYKDPMESLKEKVLDLHSSLRIYFKSLSLKYHYIFSQKNIFVGTKYRPPWLEKNELDYQNHEINRLSNT